MAKQAFVLDAELKEAVQNVVRQHLNSFQPRMKRGRRAPRSDSSSLEEVAVISLTTATWDKAAKKRTPGKATASIVSGETFDKAQTVEFKNGFGADVTITAGKFRFGYVLAGILISLDCEEFDLPS